MPNNMWWTLENSVELDNLLGMSQGEGVEVMEELKVYLLLGPHTMHILSSMTFLSSCKLHFQKHWTCATCSLSVATLRSLRKWLRLSL